MVRRKSSVFDDLVDITARLSWKTGAVLAVLSYLGFHFLATLPPPSFAPATLKEFSNGVGTAVALQFLIAVSIFLQYVVPAAFLIGAGVSIIKRRRQSELLVQVATKPERQTLESMSWREFEDLAAETFRRKGFRVIERGGKGPDGGVDLELWAGNDKYLVQCKQWKTYKVGVATVRELYGVMAAEGAVGGFVVTSGAFTHDAKRFAEGRSIELVPTETLLAMCQGRR